MQQIRISLGFMAVAAVIGVLLYHVASKPQGDNADPLASLQSTAINILQPESATTTQQPDSRFNQSRPSLIGTVIAIDGPLVDIDVFEQQPSVSTLVTTRYRLRVQSAIPREMQVGQSIEAYLIDPATLGDTEVPVSEVVVRFDE